MFHLFKKTHLAVVDYSTNFLDVSTLPNAESHTVAEHTKAIFSRYGIPKEIVSDNGPEYTGKAYKQFCIDWDIRHTTSSPEYPQSNGLAERTVQTIKRTLRKAHKAGDDIHLTLLALRTAPRVDSHQSLADLMFNRSPRTLLPTVSNTISQSATPVETKHQIASKAIRTLPELQPGDHVRIHNGKSWARTGTILNKTAQPRSYNIKMSDGRTLRRNRRHILRARNIIPESSSDSEGILIADYYPAHDSVPDNTVPATDYDSDATIPFMGDDEEDEPPRSRSGRTLKAPAHLNDFVSK